MKEWHLILMAGFYIAAGTNHFINPRIYERIIPAVFKFKKQINYISGFAEVMLGLMLLSEYKAEAAWGIILLLILIFPANVYHLQQKGSGMRIPLWVLWLRLPLQAVLILWAYQYT